MLSVGKWVKITPRNVWVDGEERYGERRAEDAMLVYVYRQSINSYPKFFKMDGLSKLGFIATELLLEGEERRFEPREDRAVVFFNRGGSISNDRHYQDTIKDADNFYPSPAIFVYTLPNIVTGEIAIRNKFYGETSFYVLGEWNPATMIEIVEGTFASDESVAECVFGLVEYIDGENFEAELLLVKRDAADGTLILSEQLLNEIKNKK